METALHTQKITILSRLIKESSLTLEEALLLLKEEEEEITEQPQEKTVDYGRYSGYGTVTFPSLNGSTYIYTTSGTDSMYNSITYSNTSSPVDTN